MCDYFVTSERKTYMYMRLIDYLQAHACLRLVIRKKSKQFSVDGILTVGPLKDH